ncbi:MAG: hypothetical protein QXN49_00745 [Archaeoglobaceae archaeon]
MNERERKSRNKRGAINRSFGFKAKRYAEIPKGIEWPKLTHPASSSIKFHEIASIASNIAKSAKNVAK